MQMKYDSYVIILHVLYIANVGYTGTLSQPVPGIPSRRPQPHDMLIMMVSKVVKTIAFARAMVNLVSPSLAI